ncbi:hypothetical protein PVK06_025495 [Gossypium arboreum]|uniref:Uncharacterized protein n=1 Tax=Gossypium arboreum TaxID=29729 RepID=A0ABR0PGZ2_GOSAR|nr:hypothetical protein PVK06_025495 [Gossypium arboreum]
MYVVSHSYPNFRCWVTKYARPDQDKSRVAYLVDLPKGTHSFGKFQALRFPCAHVIVACANARIEYAPSIKYVYSMEHMHNVWRSEFPPILDKSLECGGVGVWWLWMWCLSKEVT